MAKVIGFDDGGFRRAVRAIQRVEETPRNSREDYWPDTGADDGTFDDYVLVTGTSNDDGWYPGVTQIRAADTDVWEDITGDTVYIRGINNEDLSIDTRYKGTIVGEYDDAVAYEALGSGTGLTVTESDGSPVVNSVNRIVLDQSTGIYLANALTVSGATSTFPIQITTTTPHGFSTGMRPTITGVTGNTAANVSGVSITVINSTTFSLDDVAANGVYAGGGQVTLPGEVRIKLTPAPSIGDGVPRHRLAHAEQLKGYPNNVSLNGQPLGGFDSRGNSFNNSGTVNFSGALVFTRHHPGAMIARCGTGFSRATPYPGAGSNQHFVALPYIFAKETRITQLAIFVANGTGGSAYMSIYDNISDSGSYYYPSSLLEASGLVAWPGDEFGFSNTNNCHGFYYATDFHVVANKVYWFVLLSSQFDQFWQPIGINPAELMPIYPPFININTLNGTLGPVIAGGCIIVRRPIGTTPFSLPTVFPTRTSNPSYDYFIAPGQYNLESAINTVPLIFFAYDG